jgi:hypothetical protein
MVEYIAYHGTNSEHVESIKNNGFKSSSSPTEWLGSGVYFFVGNTFCPVVNAREWAINRAYPNKYASYSILKVLVTGDRVLDLRTEEDLVIFEGLRQIILDKYEAEKKNFKEKLHPDTFLCNSIAKSMKLDILIQNFYIKNKKQILDHIPSRVSNSAVLCAKETASINVMNIQEIEKEVITNE